MITSTAIDVNALFSQSTAPENGAVATFAGIVRNHSNGQTVQQLYYEAYSPMALKSFEEIENEARIRWSISELSIIHRIGMLAVGEIAVFILASAAHRKEALAACAYAIDRIKEITPIWKKEIF